MARHGTHRRHADRSAGVLAAPSRLRAHVTAARHHARRRRKLLHVAMGGFALALRYLTWWQAALLAVAALIFNLLMLPRLAAGLYRPGELTGSPRSGIVLYPISVLLLVVLFPNRLDIAGAAWAILAVGDGGATVAGTGIGGRRIPWKDRE